MDHTNNSLDDEDIVFMLLETLKSNGTFDELRRQCVRDIDAKPTFRNWKQRVESYVKRFLSKVKYTPELNKSIIRERLRKQLLDGCDTQDLEEGADQILSQVFAAPQILSIFELKIENAVDEYLGIKKDVPPPIELNGLKQSTDLINLSNIEISTVFNPKIDSIPDTDDKTCDKSQKDDTKDSSRSDKKEKPSSLCKEPKSLNGNKSDDENDTGGSSKEINSQYKNKTSASDKTKSSSSNHKSSRKENSCKEVVDKPKVVEKSKDIVEKSKEVVNKPKDSLNKANDIVDKFRDVINKPQDVISKTRDIVDKTKGIDNNAKDIDENVKDILEKPKKVINKPKDAIKKVNNLIDKSKDAVNKSNNLVDKSKDVINKPKDVSNKDIVDKSKEKSYLAKTSSSSSHKSSRTDKKRTKRSLEEKKKSSSLCKEPKILSGNRSDDENNAGGSSKQKSTIHKSKSTSSDKSKSSSSNHKSSRKGNSTDVVDKPKDKSVSKNSSNTNVVDETKDKSMTKNSSSTDDIDKSRTKKSTNSFITDVEKSKTKSTLSKNSSCKDNADKSKIKSSISKDSSSTIIVKKCKDKSLSKISSSHKCNPTNTKRLKLSHKEQNQLPSNKLNVEGKKPEKPEWNDFRTSIITNDEQDAANVLLSMSAISYEGSHNETITENIILLENASSTSQTSKTLSTEKELETKEDSDQMKIFPSSNNEDVTENSKVKSSNLETPQSLNSIKSGTDFSHIFEKECSVNIERLSSIDVKLQCSSGNDVKINNEFIKPSDIVVDDSELNILNNEITLDIDSENEKNNAINSNDILKVPTLKLKLLPNQIDSINKIKRKKNSKNKETKKIKQSNSCDISNEINDNLSMNTNCEQIDQKSNNDIDVKNNDFELSDHVFQKDTENSSSIGFIGFTKSEALPTNRHIQFKNFINTLPKLIHDNVNDNGFKGFTTAEAIPCKHRDTVYAELIKLKESGSSTGFIGFSEEETRKTIGHKYVEQHLEVAKKQNNEDNQQQNNEDFQQQNKEDNQQQNNEDNQQQNNMKCGGNGLQNGKTFNKVMAILYESNNDNDATPKEIYNQSNQPNDNNKKDGATVNNNNHNHDNWVVEQEMKYKLLPVKVKLERLMEFRCNNAKRVSESPQVPI